METLVKHDKYSEENLIRNLKKFLISFFNYFNINVYLFYVKLIFFNLFF